MTNYELDAVSALFLNLQMVPPSKTLIISPILLTDLKAFRKLDADVSGPIGPTPKVNKKKHACMRGQ